MARSVVAPLACISRTTGSTFAANPSAPARFALALFARASFRFVRLPSLAPWAFFAASAARIRCRSCSARAA